VHPCTRAPTVASKLDKVADSRRGLKARRAKSANEWTNQITIDEIWYYWC
jgi:hypothetical protein